MYNSVHNFNKYTMSNFIKILSNDSSFDTLNRFYKDIKQLEGVRSQTNERKQRK